MGAKAEHWLAALKHAPVALRRFRSVCDDIGCLPACAFDAELIQVRELNRNASEIVPDAGKDFVDLNLGFIGKGGAQIVPSDAIFRQQRADCAHERAGEVRRAPAIHAFDRAQKPDRDRADGPIDNPGTRLRHRVVY